MSPRRRVAERTRIDDELGPIRWCERCAEWWPDDDEFWIFNTYKAGQVTRARNYVYVRKTSGIAATCRACHGEEVRVGYVRRRAKAGVTMHRCRARSCPVFVPVGRPKCYGCSTGTIGPMTLERLTALRGQAWR